MGGGFSHNRRSKVLNEQRVLSQVWSKVENNPQYHANLFFSNFCDTYPQYSKYFTSNLNTSLTIDIHTSIKFLRILNTIGYLMTDYYNQPKQLKCLIGYLAMVHKDMNLSKSDMFNFGESLIDYLSITFSITMTPEYQRVFSRYIHNLTDEISRKIDEFQTNDYLNNLELTKKSLVQWLFCQDKLIYGKTLNYWNERKRKWEEKLEEWNQNYREKSFSNISKYSSTYDDDNDDDYDSDSDNIKDTSDFKQISYRKNETEDETTDSSLQLKKLNENVGVSSSNKRRITLRTKRPGQTNFEIVEVMTTIDDESIDLMPISKADYKYSSDNSQFNEPSTSEVIDSLARRRRRQKYL